MNTYSMPIFETKTTDKVVRYIHSSQLTEYFSEAYAKKIVKAQEQGALWGLYLTKTGRLRATILP
jgi:hypothetical protein